MFLVAGQFNAICQANVVVAQRFAAISLNGAENVLKVALQAAHRFADHGGAIRGVILSNGLSDALINWGSFYRDSMQEVLEITQNYFEDAARMQAELARLVEDHITVVKNDLVDSLHKPADFDMAETQAKVSLERYTLKKVTA